MREWRKTHPMSAEQRFKDNARSLAAAYKKRGVLKPEPCEVCGSLDVEMHHEDYSKPLEVHWLCREHHLAHHHEIDRVVSFGCRPRRDTWHV